MAPRAVQASSAGAWVVIIQVDQVVMSIVGVLRCSRRVGYLLGVQHGAAAAAWLCVQARVKHDLQQKRNSFLETLARTLPCGGHLASLIEGFQYLDAASY